MSKSTISIAIKMEDGRNGIHKLTLNTKDLKSILSATASEAQALNNKFINFAAVATGASAMNDTVKSLKSTMEDLTAAYSAQVEVERQLETNMRNSMNATDQEIQAIKELCSAQQALGVVGDEVQLAGAQELATYLSYEESLQRLIPVMNDMLAQQYGLNATQENAAQVASMLGKVMNGQTGALSRYGYTFDEVQEHILKFGSEAARSAVLADVVSASVGGMNQQLASTDVGRIKQLQNTLGDIKETLGSFAGKGMQMVYFTFALTSVATATTKLWMGTRAAHSWLLTLIKSQKLLNIIMLAGCGNFKNAARFTTLYGTAAKGSAAHTLALKVAMKGLMVASGVGLAILALTSIISYFIATSDQATESTDKLTKAQDNLDKATQRRQEVEDQAQSSISASISMLTLYISKIEAFKGTKEEEAELVEELNGAYGKTMGYFSSLNDWYIALTKNSEAYTKQMALEAQARIVADRIANNQEENRMLRRDIKAGKFNNKREKDWWTKKDKVGTSEEDKKKLEWVNRNKEIKDDEKLLNDLNKERADIVLPVIGASKPTTTTTPTTTTNTPDPSKDPVWTELPRNIQQYNQNISILRQELETAEGDRISQINIQIQEYSDAINELRNQGLGDKWVQEAKSIKDCETNIRILQKQLRETDDAVEAAMFNEQIEQFQQQRDAMANAGKPQEDNAPKLNENATSLRDIQGNIEYYNNALLDATSPEIAAGLNEQKKHWEELADSIRNAGLETEETKGAFETLQDGYGQIKSIGSGVESLTQALEFNGNAWQSLTGIVDAFIQIFQGVQAIVGIVQNLTSVTQAHTTAKIAETVATGASTAAQTTEAAATEATAVAQLPAIAANKALTASYMELAAASYFAAHASIPFAGFGIASGFVTASAAIVEAVGAMPFATGGIVPGNSPSGDRLLARVNSGEMILNKGQQRRLFAMLDGRAVASSGPNVNLGGATSAALASHDWDHVIGGVRSYLRPSEPVIVGGTLRVKGRELVGVLANETRIASKSGARSNIKL